MSVPVQQALAPAGAAGESHDSLVRSLEVSIEEAFAGLASVFSSPASLTLQNERDQIVSQLDALAQKLRDQGDALLTSPDAFADDDCKEAIGDLRWQINQVVGNNAKVVAQVLNKAQAGTKKFK